MGLGGLQGAPSQHWQPWAAILGLPWGAVPCQMDTHVVWRCLLAWVKILACSRGAWASRAAQIQRGFEPGGA